MQQIPYHALPATLLAAGMLALLIPVIIRAARRWRAFA